MTEASYTIKLEARKALPTNNPNTLYRFSEFQDTKIMWTNNTMSSNFAKMNYNFFTSGMVVINENGDTVQFRQWRDAKILNLDGHVFYRDFDKGYMEIILQGPLALAVSNRCLNL